MPETITFNYQLSKDLWRQFFDAHYACDRNLRMRYLWGVICITIGCLGLGGFYASRTIALLLLATGLFAVLSKQLLIIKSLRGVDRHPFLGRELTVSASPTEISVRSGDAGYSQPWGNFVGYRLLKPGLLLYHDRNAFFFIPAAAMTAAHTGHIQQFLETAHVPSL